MAIRPDWDIGTITLTASSANFTTAGAMLQTAAVETGDVIITPSGATLVIASVTGQNSGTLMLPCPAPAAGSAMPLRIRFQPDGSRFQAAYKAAAYLLSGGNVEALAGLTGAADKGIHFTGAGTLATHDLKKGARDFLAAFTATSSEIPGAQLPARLQSFTGSALANANDAREFGVYYVNLSTSNRPSGAGVGLIMPVPQLSSHLRQLFYERDTNRIWTRSCIDNAFGAWSELATNVSALQSSLANEASFELGRSLNGDRLSYIDFHSSGAPDTLDRSARIIRGAGVNGTLELSNTGSGEIRLSATSGVSVLNGPITTQWGYNTTTVAAANVYMTSSAGLVRSTSSGQFKTDIEPLADEYRDLIMQLRPVWYRSLCPVDNPEWSYYGLIAEEVAEVDPRLVHWQTVEVTYEEKTTTVQVPQIVTDEETGETTTQMVDKEITEHVRHEVELEEPRPVGVMYDRLVPHLIAKIQELTVRLEALENSG